MRTVAFHTLGCKVNIVETQAMQQLMEDAGYKTVDFEERADVYIVNTCSVTNVADKKSRQMLHRARKRNPQAIVVAAGCYVQSAAEKLKEDLRVDLVVGNDRKMEMVHILEGYYRSQEKKDFLEDMAKIREFEKLRVPRKTGHTRGFVKITDGCNQFCTYCIIPFTRGRVRSRTMENVLEEVQTLVRGGCREVVLTGIHLSSYGVDFSDQSYNARMEECTRREENDEGFLQHNGLLQLLNAMEGVEGLERIRLGSLEPRIITEGFLEGLKKNTKFCPHFHLSLQSGCNATLQRMNRRYTTEEFYQGVEAIRRHFPAPAVTTDIIVGFPGETQEEFLESLAFVQRVGFYETHIFPYSKREGTRAAKMEKQISSEEKQRRAALFQGLNAKKAEAFRRERLGWEEEILTEEEFSREGETYLTGYTREYVRVAVKKKDQKPNTLVKGRVLGFLTPELLYME